ncbi:MAG: mechanosensitive ion channel family protein [Bacteroidales bacterium]
MILTAKVFESIFWENAYEKAMDWLITDGISVLIIILITIVSFRLVRFATKRLNKFISKRSARGTGAPDPEAEKRANTLMGIFKNIMRVVIWLLFIMLLLSKFGVNIGPIIASAGILGLAIGFGAQELVRDIISGFFILLEDQLRTGDVAIINGTAGLVEDIELRTITLRDFAGTVHIFQNGKINTLANMTKEWSAIVLDIGVAYKEDIDHVMEIMKEVGEDLAKDDEFGKMMIEPIEIFGLNEFGDSALVIKARIKTKPGDQWSTGREYRRRLKIAFDSKNIEIPFPHTTVYWGDEISPLSLRMENKAE